MDCPNCKLVNPPEAERCDCGFDFKTREMKKSYLTDRDKRLLAGPARLGAIALLLITGARVLFMGYRDKENSVIIAGWIAIAVGLVIWARKRKPSPR